MKIQENDTITKFISTFLKRYLTFKDNWQRYWRQFYSKKMTHYSKVQSLLISQPWHRGDKTSRNAQISKDLQNFHDFHEFYE